MRQYKIENVYDLQMNPKTDEDSYRRIGRIVEIDFSELQRIVGKNKRAIIHYTFDKDGTELFMKFLVTSWVTALNWNVDKSVITMTTENSVYKFCEV